MQILPVRARVQCEDQTQVEQQGTGPAQSLAAPRVGRRVLGEEPERHSEDELGKPAKDQQVQIGRPDHREERYLIP